MIKINIILKYPPGRSIMELEKLSAIWNIRLIADTNKVKAQALIRPATFQKMFNISPKKGTMEVPDTLAYFIDFMEVIDV